MKMMSSARPVALALLLASVSSLATAQDCSDLLTQNVTASSADRYSSYAYYNLIDTEEEYTREKSGSGSGDFLGLISGSGSFNDYMQRRSQRLSITSMNMEAASAERVLLASVTEGQVAAWRDCMARSGEALVVYLDDIWDAAATLNVAWDPPPGVAVQSLVSAEVRGVTSDPGTRIPITSITDRLPQRWGTEQSLSLIVDRLECSEMRISITVGGYSDNLRLPACPTEKPPKVQPPIQTQVFPVTGTAGSFPTARSCLPEGWKLIGGGAHVDYGASVGVLLTGSYPDSRCWVAEAKAHTVSASGIVTAFAVGLYDPEDEWVVEVFSGSGPIAAIPQALSAVPNTMVLTGCGGRINWKGYGNLLTGIYPSSQNTCSVFGKQHYEPDPATATAFAIGIRPRNGADLPVASILANVTGPSTRPKASVSLPAACMISGGGANIDWSGSPGLLLTSSIPVGTGWYGFGKDHSVAGAGRMSVYVIGFCQ